MSNYTTNVDDTDIDDGDEDESQQQRRPLLMRRSRSDAAPSLSRAPPVESTHQHRRTRFSPNEFQEFRETQLPKPASHGAFGGAAEDDHLRDESVFGSLSTLASSLSSTILMVEFSDKKHNERMIGSGKFEWHDAGIWRLTYRIATTTYDNSSRYSTRS
jgi:hypothetical protein